MTLKALASQYRQSAKPLFARILLLRGELKRERDPGARLALERRLRLLYAMYMETRRTAGLLEHYYDERSGGLGC